MLLQTAGRRVNPNAACQTHHDLDREPFKFYSANGRSHPLRLLPFEGDGMRPQSDCFVSAIATGNCV